MNFDTDCTEEDIKAFQESYVYPLMPLLKNGVFHVTSIKGFRRIQQCDFIIPNKGQFHCKHPQTKHYYGYSKGYICLFDFESSNEQDYITNYLTWQHFFGDYEPFTIVLKLSRQKLADKLIPNSNPPQKVSEPEYKGFIPFVECWYPEKIPFSAIDSFIVVSTNREKYVYEFEEFSKDEIAKLNQKLKPVEDSIKRLETLLQIEIID